MDVRRQPEACEGIIERRTREFHMATIEMWPQAAWSMWPGQQGPQVPTALGTTRINL